MIKQFLNIPFWVLKTYQFIDFTEIKRAQRPQ